MAIGRHLYRGSPAQQLTVTHALAQMRGRISFSACFFSHEHTIKKQKVEGRYKKIHKNRRKTALLFSRGNPRAIPTHSRADRAHGSRTPSGCADRTPDGIRQRASAPRSRARMGNGGKAWAGLSLFAIPRRYFADLAAKRPLSRGTVLFRTGRRARAPGENAAHPLEQGLVLSAQAEAPPKRKQNSSCK